MVKGEEKTLRRKPKTFKGRKILKKREPQVIEGVKKTIFIRGSKTSNEITTFIHDLYMMKKDNSVFLGKRVECHPFENVSNIEQLCKKNDVHLFIFASHSKKRPNNIVIGRIFNDQILDMVELGLTNLVEQSKKISIPIHSRPCIFFQGDLFEFDALYIRMKNLILDFFVENTQVENLDIVKGFSHLVVVSANESKIYFRTYVIEMQDKKADGDDFFKLIPMGPDADFDLKRNQFAPDDQYKVACKQPKIKKRKEDKNVSRDSLGDKRGRLYVDHQDLDTLALKQRKKINKRDKIDAANLKKKNKVNSHLKKEDEDQNE